MKTKYVAFDGQEFDKREDCLDHENSVVRAGQLEEKDFIRFLSDHVRKDQHGNEIVTVYRALDFMHNIVIYYERLLEEAKQEADSLYSARLEGR